MVLKDDGNKLVNQTNNLQPSFSNEKSTFLGFPLRIFVSMEMEEEICVILSENIYLYTDTIRSFAKPSILRFSRISCQ